jgi:hypothetical protein
MKALSVALIVIAMSMGSIATTNSPKTQTQFHPSETRYLSDFAKWHNDNMLLENAPEEIKQMACGWIMYEFWFVRISVYNNNGCSGGGSAGGGGHAW